MESIDNSAKGRVLLLIDVSASLQLESRKYKLRAALAQWIENYAPDGIILSIVKFSCRAKELHGPTILNSKSRKGLIHILPIRSEGKSCIYHGIQKAIEVASPGTVIVTMTNGDISETKEEIHAVKELVRNAHMTSITIVLGNVMKDGLQEIGTTYQVQDKYGVPGLINALQNALHSSLSSVSPPVVLLEAELMYMERMSGIFQVDSTTSANLCMSISFWPGSTDVSIKLTRPDGLSYPTQLAEQYYHNCSSNRMAGKWKLDVVSESEATFMAALITAESYQNDKSIKFHCSINNDADPPSMYAVLQQGKLPVRGANVTAELWFVDGTVSNFALFDNGLGSDTLVGDGVYSRYILPHLHRTGWYSALCRATGNVTTGNQSLGESITRIARTELTKIVTKESFYPPVSITDLRVTYNDSSLILHFTSPGAELDWGQGSQAGNWIQGFLQRILPTQCSLSSLLLRGRIKNCRISPTCG
ncbi:calcium-activated chloride channel regulator 4 isoform X2 [Anabrus simplex]|uniref:calcium-activated chloride channel regulator 4 isoform X2 n=1 Tax=Anabrus simplex TaxID=316456 RepID=UPI0035A3B743